MRCKTPCTTSNHEVRGFICAVGSLKVVRPLSSDGSVVKNQFWVSNVFHHSNVTWPVFLRVTDSLRLEPCRVFLKYFCLNFCYVTVTSLLLWDWWIYICSLQSCYKSLVSMSRFQSNFWMMKFITVCYFTTGSLPPISSSWRQAPWDPHISPYYFMYRKPKALFSNNLVRNDAINRSVFRTITEKWTGRNIEERGCDIVSDTLINFPGRNVSRDSAVDISTGYGLDDWEVGARVAVGSRIITSPCRPDRLWGPPNLLYNGYRELFPGGKAAEAWSWPLTSN
jgi:hypothetical protein